MDDAERLLSVRFREAIAPLVLVMLERVFSDAVKIAGLTAYCTCRDYCAWQRRPGHASFQRFFL